MIPYLNQQHRQGILWEWFAHVCDGAGGGWANTTTTFSTRTSIISGFGWGAYPARLSIPYGLRTANGLPKELS